MSRDEQTIIDYLLGELDAEARAAVEARAAADPAFAGELEGMRPVVSGLDEMPAPGWSVAEPPPLPPLPGLESPRRRSWWSSGTRSRPALAFAAVVAALAVAGASWWAVARDDGAGADGPVLALAPIGDAAPSVAGEAHSTRDGDALAVSVSGMPASAPGTFYELWLMDGPERLVSLGAFRVPESGDTSVEVPLPVELTDFAYIDVSQEPDDGNPAHSGDSLLRGASS